MNDTINRFMLASPSPFVRARLDESERCVDDGVCCASDGAQFLLIYPQMCDLSSLRRALSCSLLFKQASFIPVEFNTHSLRSGAKQINYSHETLLTIRVLIDMLNAPTTAGG
jgi:hypothetical protein